MPKLWTNDDALVDAVAGNLFDVLPMLPKRLVSVDELVKAAHMPFSHLQILCLLVNKPMSVGQISQTLGIAKPNVTPLVDNLCSRGLLERVRSAGDRRVVYVQLLPAGREMANQVRAMLVDQVRRWPRALTPSEIRRFNNALAYLLRVCRELDLAPASAPEKDAQAAAGDEA